MKTHPTRCCCVHHDHPLVERRTPAGGVFFGCPLFAAEGCRYSWSDRDDRYFGPGISARPAGLRDRTLLRLINGGFSPEEALEFINGEDIREVESLLEA